MIALRLLRGSVALATVLALAQAAPALSASSGQSHASAKVICREVIPTGTMLRASTICMSKAAWNKSVTDREADDDYSREFLRLKFPANPDALQTGTANWDKLPKLVAKGRLPYLQLVSGVRESLRAKDCTLPGQTPKSFDLTIRYAVLLEPGGTAGRVLVEDSGCASINALIGLSAMARSERGDFRPTRVAKARWHADSMNLILQ